MLDLPDGSVLYVDQYTYQYYVFQPTFSSTTNTQVPMINTITQTGCDSFMATGTLFNGNTEGAAYGDDWQMATNYPIFRLMNGSRVYYARSYNWNRTGVQTGLEPDTAYFVLPA